MTDKGDRAFQAMYESIGSLSVEVKQRRAQIEASVTQLLAVTRAAEALLSKLDHITTSEFAIHGEREEREKLRDELEVWHTLQD